MIGRGPKAIWLIILTLGSAAAPASAGAPPAWLPKYDLDIRLDTTQRIGTVTERVTWTNTSDRPIAEIVFNAHAHYTIPSQDIGTLAKILEILRMSPSEAMSFDGPALDVRQVNLLSPTNAPVCQLPFHFQADNATALVVPLRQALQPGGSVTLELHLTLKIPPKKGRWGQWEGVTTLAQWLPVVAVYERREARDERRGTKGEGQDGQHPPLPPPSQGDISGSPGSQGGDISGSPPCEGGVRGGHWNPTPFIPWHQPFYNEAGLYTVRITLPADQKLACSGIIQESRDLGNGWTRHTVAPICLRDFALICSARFQEYVGRCRRHARMSRPGLARARILRPERLLKRSRRPCPSTIAGSAPTPIRSSPSPKPISAGTATSAAAWS